MANRLPLILSQPARRDASATELIENIVAATLMLPKLDANLIGDIDSIEPGSTDHLCLQGHARDVILASFHDLATAEAAWRRLGQAGTFIDCALAADEIRLQASGASERRVFYFQLAYNLKVPRLLDRCQELIAAQAVQLVSIQFGGAALKSNSLPIVAQSAANPPKPASVVPAAATHREMRAELRAENRADADEDWSSIDKLVDDLDALDI